MPTLDQINGLAPAAARDFFFSICGSSRWAGAMAGCRPYWDISVVFNAADVIWEYLTDEDRREALRNRAGVDPEGLPKELQEDLEYYRTKFGYPFIVAGPVPGNEELLTVLRRRLEYPAKAEFELAAREEGLVMRAELRRRLAG
jgi:hypothetical protein